MNNVFLWQHISISQISAKWIECTCKTSTSCALNFPSMCHLTIAIGTIWSTYILYVHIQRMVCLSSIVLSTMINKCIWGAWVCVRERKVRSRQYGSTPSMTEGKARCSDPVESWWKHLAPSAPSSPGLDVRRPGRERWAPKPACLPACTPFPISILSDDDTGSGCDQWSIRVSPRRALFLVPPAFPP
jgi:hypothetical protein